MAKLTDELRDFLVRSTRHPLSFIGVNLTTLTGVLLAILLALALVGAPTNPYLGAVTFLVLPLLFVLGLVLIPIGSWRYRRRAPAPGGTGLFPSYDLNSPRVRTRLVLLAVLTLTNITILGVASYKGIEHMDSVAFCGGTCHPVMKPEYTAYQGSPHARVRCVDCHIGPGASWFVQSKLSGTRQVFKQILHTWPTPIETPITNLRPSRDTCEQCHWPEKFHGDRLVVRKHFEEDEANTPIQSVLLLKVGGGNPDSGFRQGIHWHVSSTVYYRSDEKREVIPWVRVERRDGSVAEFTAAGGVPDSIAARPMRRMDCIDCHNRPTHIYRLPARALDEAMADGRLPVDLPYLKREALAALTTDYANATQARAGIADRLNGFYRDAYPEVAPQRQEGIAQAIAAVQQIWARNVFPEMKVGWGTYPEHIGHQDFTGCFRCHDEQHATTDGASISQDCSTCHSLLAMEEEKPAVLETLFPEGE
jgi:nitrate/TMAO reductase-like tetraheme cytochrome c subunit